MKIWTNGCFDVLHPGHLHLLQFAKSLGGELIVGIDSDDKIKRDKGPNRPYFRSYERKAMLEALRCVDKVLVFNSKEELEEQVRLVQPDIMVVGEEYQGREVVGSQFAKQVKFVSRISGLSTTNILNGNIRF